MLTLLAVSDCFLVSPSWTNGQPTELIASSKAVTILISIDCLQYFVVEDTYSFRFSHCNDKTFYYSMLDQSILTLDSFKLVLISLRVL